jgi:hypothetical protein
MFLFVLGKYERIFCELCDKTRGEILFSECVLYQTDLYVKLYD